MQVDIGTTAKCLNSTSTKFNKLHNNIDVKLKEPTSITHPHFMVHLSGISEIYKCNYLHNTQWGYYYIDDIIYETNDIATLICHRDVLATGKSLILQTEAYVNYMSLMNAYNLPFTQDDPRINPDIQYSYREMYPITNMAGMTFSSTGCVLIKTLAFTSTGESGGAESGIVTYIMDTISFMEMARLCADELVGNLTDAVRYLLGDNMKDNLLCARWLPLDFGSVKTKYSSLLTKKINLAGFVVGISNDVVCFDSVSQIENLYGTINLDFAASGTLPQKYPFIRGEKYTKIQFVHPGGNLDLSSDDFIATGDQVNFKLSIDMCSGDYAIKIKPAGGTGTGTASVLSGTTYPIITGTIATDWTHFWSTMSNPGLKVLGAAFKTAASIGTAMLGGGMDFGGITTSREGFGYMEGKGYGIYDFNKTTNIGSVGSGGISAALTGIGGAIESSAHNGRTYNGSVTSNIMTCHALVGNGEDMGHMFRFEVSTYAPHIMFQNSQSGMDYYPSFCKKYGYPTFADVPISLLSEQDKSNYVQCAGFNLLNTTSSTPVSVTKPLTPKEIAEINTLMNSGVIIE